MEFLKDVLGQKYDDFVKSVGDYNEKNPEKPVKLINLTDGEYVEKNKFLTLEAKYESDTKELLNKIKKAEFDYSLELMIKSAKPKNAKALKALIDFDKITYENGVISGFDEQISRLKKEEGYLFEDGAFPQFSRPVSGTDSEITRDEFKKLSYMEKLKLKKESPKIFSKLK